MNFQPRYPNVRRARYVPPLMQTCPATGITDSKHCMAQPQLTSPSNQNVVNQNATTSNRNRNRITSQGFSRTQPSTSTNNENAATNNFNFKIFGSTENERMCIFTGTVERVIKWSKIFQNHLCYYEVIASVISIQEGSVESQKIMLLRDKKGPILQTVYYNTTHINIEDFHVGQVLRCLGRMSGANVLNAVSIRSACQEEIETLQRHCLACDQAIAHFLSA